jgi:hypothetical protein
MAGKTLAARLAKAAAAAPRSAPRLEPADETKAPGPAALFCAIEDLDRMLGALEREANRFDEALDRLGGAVPEALASCGASAPASINAMGRLHDEADYLAHLVALVTASNDRLEQLV